MDLSLRQPGLLSPQAHELPPAILRLLEGVERSLTSPNSRRAYRTALLHFLNWCRASDAKLERMSVLQYKDALIAAETAASKRRFSAATVNLKLAAVRSFAQEAADQHLISPSEAAAIQRIRGERTSGTRFGMWLEKQELDRLLRTPDRTTLRGKRDYALLAVLFSTGLRRRELVDLQLSTIQQRDGQWGLIDLQGKGNRVRSVHLPLWVKDAVFAWLTSAGIVDGPIFRSISRHGRIGVRRLSDESVKLVLSYYALSHNLGGFRPHDARRTCARLCRSANASLEDIQELLGHSSIQTTERYLGRTGGFQRAITNAITEPV
jgi:integrase